MSDIPTLQEQIPDQQENEQKDIQQENPFLPYHHLRQLAQEREQFRQELEAYTRNMQIPLANTRTTTSTQDAISIDGNGEIPEHIVREITNTIINQMTPLIESQVRALLEHKLKQ